MYRISDAYLLYREPDVIIERRDSIKNANGGEVPPAILGGRYRLAPGTGVTSDPVFERTSASVAAFQTDPRRFLENLAHVSHVDWAFVNGQPLPARDFVRFFKFLWDDEKVLPVDPTCRIELGLEQPRALAYELHVNLVWTDAAMAIRFQFLDGSGAVAYDASFPVGARRPRSIHVELDRPVPIRRLKILLSTVDGRSGRARINDLRVQGQTPELAQYIQKNLAFGGR